ncbi:MAG TPA: alpha/beta hydrolase [Verrucomicrobiae bacterium]|nr:alpha/beta hydrolase [Verrucomicrobiae bacterium]
MPTLGLACRCDDGVEIPATLYMPATPPLATLVIAAGMGIPRRFYGRFAAAMAARGIAALTFDYRGIGEAARAVTDPRRVRFQDWGSLDLHAVLGEAFRRHPGLPVFHCGHSAGAQIVGLTPLAEKLAGLVLVAGPRPHASQDRGAYRVFSSLWWYVIVPLASRGRWFPARRLGFSSIDVPAGVTAEWGRWARSHRYLFSPQFGIDTARYARLSQPLLAWSFSDDRYAPPASIEALLTEFPAARIERRHLRPADAGARAIGHLGFFRDAFRDTLWRETADWIERLARAS